MSVSVAASVVAAAMLVAAACSSGAGIDRTSTGSNATHAVPSTAPSALAPTFWSATEGSFGMIYGTANGPTAFGILRTDDAGASWSLAGSRPLPSHDHGAAVAFLGPAVWLAMPDAATLLRTTDAGQTWTTSRATGLPDRPDLLDFADAQHAWALVSLSACTGFKSDCAAREGLYSTANGGITWTALWPGRPR